MYYYILANAVMYVIFGLWCAIKPANTAKSVGFSLNGPQGFAEYIAVYGGLEFSIGVILFAALFNPVFHRPAIIALLIFYICLVIFRASSILRFGSDIGAGWNFFVFEILLMLTAFFLYRSGESK